jgi:hypothetical protein
MKLSKKLAVAASLSALALSGCYVVPAVGPSGEVIYQHYPLPPVGMVPGPGAAPFPHGPAIPTVLQARLYPANDIAARTGVLSGTVTNMMTGKGRFQIQVGGEILTGEATRVSNDERRGVASAFGSGGTSMSCEYQMNSPVQGAGSCTLSNGAKYQVHIGS